MADHERSDFPDSVRRFFLEIGVNVDRPDHVDALARAIAFAQAQLKASEASRKRRSVIGWGAASATATTILSAVVASIFPGVVEWLTTHVPAGLFRPAIK